MPKHGPGNPMRWDLLPAGGLDAPALKSGEICCLATYILQRAGSGARLPSILLSSMEVASVPGAVLGPKP